MYYNSLKKYIIQAMNGEEVLAEEKVEEQPIQLLAVFTSSPSGSTFLVCPITFSKLS